MFFLSAFWQNGLPFGISMALGYALFNSWEKGLTYGAFGGFAYGLLMASIAYFNSLKYTRNRPLLSNERLIEEGPANYHLNRGWIYLTNTRLFFVSEKISLITQELSIPISEIMSAEKGRTYGVISNKLILNLKNGDSEEVIVPNPKNWVNRIKKISNLLSEAPRDLSIYD